MEGEYEGEGEEDEDEEDDGEGQDEEFDGLEDMPGQLDPDDVVFVSAAPVIYQPVAELTCHRPPHLCHS